MIHSMISAIMIKMALLAAKKAGEHLGYTVGTDETVL